MNITEIKNFSTEFYSDDGLCHESLLRSYQVLMKIQEMLCRNDSRETILEYMSMCGYEPNVNSNWRGYDENR